MLDLSLTNKKAIICGSTQRIGKATVLELPGLGAAVTVIARKEDKFYILEDCPPDISRYQFIKLR